MELAKTSNVPVLYTDSELPLEVSEPVRTADAPIAVQMSRAPIMAFKPTGETVPLAEVVTSPPTEVLVASAKPAMLPKTGSSLPSFLLLGLLALAGGFIVRTYSLRSR